MIIKKEFAPVTIFLQTKEELDEFKSILIELQKRTHWRGFINTQDKYDAIAQRYLNLLK